MNGEEAQCFLLPEWQQVAHLVVDYRALMAWAPRAEVLYAAAQIDRAAEAARAEVEHAATVAAQAREAQARAALLDEQRRSKRMTWLAGGLGVVAVVLGGVVVGVVVTR